MNINLHNYEEYFILYMDNELSSDDRRMVEAFVQQHPELKEELDTLLQYKLIPDSSVVFAGKEELLKENGHSLITVTNYEEWLSLYADNELDKEQRASVERFINENPFAKRDLELFLKTRLQPEEIIFPGKKSLYRTQEKRRIIPFAWRAAAAILILLLGISAFLFLNNKAGNGNTDVAVKTNKAVEEKNSDNKNRETVLQEDQQLVNNQEDKQLPVIPVDEKEKAVITNDKSNNNSVATNEKNKSVIVSPTEKEQTPAPKIEDAVVAESNNNKPSNNLPQPVNRIIAESNSANNTGVADVSPAPKDDANEEADVTKDNASSSDYIYTSNEKKNKNRGIFRKIARTFEKRTSIDPTDDNKLLVGGLAIKLK